MGISLAVDEARFESEVLEASFGKPVIVDFYATWCGPCQLLKPMLESLVEEYDFILAKIDIDANPDLAQAYGVSGVPDVRIVQQGQVTPGFVGVLPEPELRALIEGLQIEGLNLQSTISLQIAAVKAVIAQGKMPEAKAALDQLFDAYPTRNDVALLAAHFLIQMKQLAPAAKMLASIAPDQALYPEAEAMKGLLMLHPTYKDYGESAVGQAFSAAVTAALAEQYEAALMGFLEVVKADRKFHDDGAHKSMIRIFTILGEANPLTLTYRKQMVQAMY
jgi:putative thioredoxin